MARRVRPLRRQRIAGLCLAALLPAAAACGPTAEQLESRQATQGASASSSAPSPQQARVRTAEPEPAPPSTPLEVGVSGAQAAMAPEVQAECQWLLRRDSEPFPAAAAGACVSAAMVAGQSAKQSVTTSASWLPPGTYSMDFHTAPGFRMDLRGQDGELEISVDGDSRTLRTGTASVVAANSGGSPEESYAAVLVDAAELTANPERVRGLLESAGPAAVDYGASYNGVPAIRLTATIEPGGDDGLSGSVVLVLDDLYRPLLIEYAGTTRGISSSIRAAVTEWGGD